MSGKAEPKRAAVATRSAAPAPAAAMPDAGLRLMIYDRSCRGFPVLPGLSHAWWAGAQLYRSLGRLHAYRGVDTWEQALEWLVGPHAIRPVLATKCYGCHASTLRSPMGGLVLDTKAGLAKGGVTGPADGGVRRPGAGPEHDQLPLEVGGEVPGEPRASARG